MKQSQRCVSGSCQLFERKSRPERSATWAKSKSLGFVHESSWHFQASKQLGSEVPEIAWQPANCRHFAAQLLERGPRCFNLGEVMPSTALYFRLQIRQPAATPG